MAFVQEEEQPNQVQGAAPQGAVSTGGAGVAGTNKAASAPGKNVPAQPSAQLSSYLNANQAQGQQMAQAIAGNLSNQVQGAQNAIAPAVNTYTGSLYTVPTDQTVNQVVSKSPSSLTPDQAATYQKELNAANQAPNSANTFESSQPYQDVSGQIQNAVQTANLWNAGNNPANLSTAVEPFEAAGATQGDKTLDALLISRNPQAYSQIQQAVTPAANLQGNLTTATQSADQALRDAIAQDQATTPAAQQAAQTYATGLNQTLAQYLANAQNDVNTYNGEINPLANNLANIQPQVSTLQDAIDAYNALLAGGPGVTGAGDTTGSFTPITKGNVGAIPSVAMLPDVAQLATPQQYADLEALKNLVGSGEFGALNTMISPDQSALAGTWTPAANASIPTLQELLDPLTSSAIQGIIPNINTAKGLNPMVQAESPLVQKLQSVQAALDALMAASGSQPPIGQPAAPPAQYQQSPNGTIPDKNAPVGSPAYNLWLRDTYPNSDLSFGIDENGNLATNLGNLRPQ